MHCERMVGNIGSNPPVSIKYTNSTMADNENSENCFCECVCVSVCVCELHVLFGSKSVPEQHTAQQCHSRTRSNFMVFIVKIKCHSNIVHVFGFFMVQAKHTLFKCCGAWLGTVRYKHERPSERTSKRVWTKFSGGDKISGSTRSNLSELTLGCERASNSLLPI